MTIVGKGSAKYVVIDARKNGRIFNIAKKGKLKLINITLKNGFLSGDDFLSGAAIYNKGSLSINKCIFSKNRVYWGNYSSEGGAISNSGLLKVKNSIFLKNNADSGGAIANSDGKAYISNCKFLYNEYDFEVSAICNFYDEFSRIVIKKSYFKNCGIENFADYGQIINNKFNIAHGKAIFNQGDYTIISHNSIISKSYNSEFAIYSFSDNSKLRHNKIRGFFEGIIIVGFKNRVNNNLIYGQNYGKGIYIGWDFDYESNGKKLLYFSKYNIITKNKVIKFEYGIYIEKGFKTNRISYNKLISNKIGLASSYKFKNKSNIYKGNKKNLIKIKG